MDELDELLRLFSTPRPNGSVAIQQTSRAVQTWLHARHIPFQLQPYTQYPYFFEASGVWMILTRTLLAVSAWLGWAWWTPILALAGLLGGTLDSALHLPLVTWPGKRLGENILIDLDLTRSNEPALPPGGTKAPELIFTAHYDSKTELLDHRQRMFFLLNIPTGILLTILVGAAGALQAAWRLNPPAWGTWVYWAGALLSLPLAMLALGYGLDLSLGRLVKPSPGAVDDGAACVILLKLAERLWQGPKNMDGSEGDLPEQPNKPPINPHITIVLFSGEEIDRQGSRAFVRSRMRTGGEAVLNLEAMAQDGNYVTWQRDGSVYRLRPTDKRLDNAIRQAVERITGEAPVGGGPVLSDAASFIERGLPAAVLGTYDRRWKDAGFHRPSDNLERVMVDRIDEGVNILLQFMRELEEQ
jgi:hypothetical protein